MVWYKKLDSVGLSSRLKISNANQYVGYGMDWRIGFESRLDRVSAVHHCARTSTKNHLASSPLLIRGCLRGIKVAGA
jgi:hypothetical protein